MSTLGVTSPNLADVAKAKDPSGAIGLIIPLLESSNTIVFDAPAYEGNLAVGHQSIQRVTRGSGTWRSINEGIAAEKGTTKQVIDVCGELAGLHKMDTTLYALNGGAEYRRQDLEEYVAGMTQEIAETILYGNIATSPKEFQGLAPRYNSTTGGYASQIISAGGSGSDNRSIWLITWGQKTCHLFYPKGTNAGIEMNDMGKQLVSDGTNDYTAYVEDIKWRVGLALPDYRQVIRICNIDVSDLTVDAASGADLIRQMVKAIYSLPTANMFAKNRVFYVSPTIAEYLQLQASNKSNVNLTPANAEGEPYTKCIGIPIKPLDALETDEATVS